MINKDTEWHLSKSVPITLVVAIVCQTIALVWYVSSLDNNVKNNTKEILRQEVRIEKIRDCSTRPGSNFSSYR